MLEYGSVIWAGAAESHTARIDRVQHKFLMWLLSYTIRIRPFSLIRKSAAPFQASLSLVSSNATRHYLYPKHFQAQH